MDYRADTTLAIAHDNDPLTLCVAAITSVIVRCSIRAEKSPRTSQYHHSAPSVDKVPSGTLAALEEKCAGFIAAEADESAAPADAAAGTTKVMAAGSHSG